MKALKIQSKNLLNMKMVVNYLNFVFHIKVKTKSIESRISFFKLSKTRNDTLVTRIQFTVALDDINCFSIWFYDNSQLVLKMRFQAFSFASQKVRGLSSVVTNYCRCNNCYFIYKTGWNVHRSRDSQQSTG